MSAPCFRLECEDQVGGPTAGMTGVTGRGQGGPVGCSLLVGDWPIYSYSQAWAQGV